MSDKAENLSRAKVVAKVVAKEDCRSKGGKIDDHYCSILLSEMEAKDARIAELERDNLKMKMFISSVASAMKNKNVALHHLSCRAKELLAKGDE